MSYWRDLLSDLSKDFIKDGIKWLAAVLLATGVVAAGMKSSRDWLLGDSHLIRGAVVLLMLSLTIVAAYLIRERSRVRNIKVEIVNATAPVRFAPESFDLTPARRRALLVLRHRPDQKTTLHELHRLVTEDGPYIDRQTTKARLQQDIEDAERAGLVSIERVGDYTHYYRLTTPDGRNWVNANERELQKGAGEGMTKKDLRSPL
jgi:hypothetical protein